MGRKPQHSIKSLLTAVKPTKHSTASPAPDGAGVGSSGWKPRETKSKHTIAPDGADLSTRTIKPSWHGSRRPSPGRLFCCPTISQGFRPELPTRTPPEPSIVGDLPRQSRTLFSPSEFQIETEAHAWQTLLHLREFDQSLNPAIECRIVDGVRNPEMRVELTKDTTGNNHQVVLNRFFNKALPVAPW